MHDHPFVGCSHSMMCIYCPNKKLMNHFEMKKLDRQMHITLYFSPCLSSFSCVCCVYVWQIFVPSIFVFTIETVYLFNACAIHFRIMVRYMYIYGDILSLGVKVNVGGRALCPLHHTLSNFSLSFDFYSFWCALVQNYDKGILLGLKIGHPLCDTNVIGNWLHFTPVCLLPGIVIGIYNSTYYINIIQIIVCVCV